MNSFHKMIFITLQNFQCENAVSFCVSLPSTGEKVRTAPSGVKPESHGNCWWSSFIGESPFCDRGVKVWRSGLPAVMQRFPFPQEFKELIMRFYVCSLLRQTKLSLSNGCNFYVVYFSLTYGKRASKFITEMLKIVISVSLVSICL